MQLTGHRILVQAEQPEEKTAGGIFIPENIQKPRNVGKIIAIGNEVDEKLLGKSAMFEIQSGKPLEHGDIKGTLLFDVDIIATL